MARWVVGARPATPSAFAEAGGSSRFVVEMPSLGRPKIGWTNMERFALSLRTD